MYTVVFLICIAGLYLLSAILNPVQTKQSRKEWDEQLKQMQEDAEKEEMEYKLKRVGKLNE